MSPTSYQAAPPRNVIVTIEWGSVKPSKPKDVEKAHSASIQINVYGRVSCYQYFAQTSDPRYRGRPLRAEVVSFEQNAAPSSGGELSVISGIVPKEIYASFVKLDDNNFI